MPHDKLVKEIEFELGCREFFDAVQKEHQNARTPDTSFCIKNKITHILTPTVLIIVKILHFNY